MEIGGGAAGGGPAAAPAPACHGQSSLLGVKAGSGPAPGAPQDESKSLGLAAPGLAGALGARGAKKRRPLLGRGALQNFGGAEIQSR